MCFPSASWNKAGKIGSKYGALLSPNAVAKMLVSLGYKQEDISCKDTKKLEL